MREPGQLVLPTNIERTIAAPLDAATVVSGVSALTSDVFISIVDGNDYSYKGQIVSVIDDIDPNNNGVYMLGEYPSTVLSNWIKIQNTLDTDLITPEKNIVSAVNDLYTSAITRHDEFESEIDFLSSNIDNVSSITKAWNTRIDNDVQYVSASLVAASSTLNDKLDNVSANLESDLTTQITTTSSNIVSALVLSSDTLINSITDVNNVLSAKISNLATETSNTITSLSSAIDTQVQNIYTTIDVTSVEIKNDIQALSQETDDHFIQLEQIVDSHIKTVHGEFFQSTRFNMPSDLFSILTLNDGNNVVKYTAINSQNTIKEVIAGSDIYNYEIINGDTISVSSILQTITKYILSQC